MSEKPYKFGRLDPAEVEIPHVWGNLYEKQQTTGPQRLCIAAAGGFADLMLRMVMLTGGPCKLLYILHTARWGSETLRYESPALDLQQVTEFFEQFSEYLENDGRHEIWIHSRPQESNIVYDMHNLIYAYGPLDTFENLLLESGFREDKIEMPVPHTHHYNPEYDKYEDMVVKYYDWIKSPLHEDDGY